MGITKAAWGVYKSFVMRFGQRSSQFFVVVGGGRPLNMTDVRAEKEANSNSAAIACIRWIQRNWSEAPITVGKLDKNDLVKVVDSRLLKLLRAPNEYYSGLTMMKAFIADYILTGNAYIIKARSTQPGGIDGRGRVEALWWVPSFSINPINDPSKSTIFIDHYQYSIDSKDYDIHVKDIIHLRDGFDPNNTMVGISGFRALLRELCSDNEATAWTWSLLKNMGVPGIVISPGKDTEIAKDDAEEMKENFVQRFTGANRGMPMVVSSPVEVKNVSFNPQEMSLDVIHRFSAERISAVIGVPPAVVGLTTATDVNGAVNYPEAREAAYESCMIPLQQDVADTLNLQLLPEFHNPDNYMVMFDTTKVRVLQPDINALHVRVRGNLLSGLITLNTALKQIGEDPIGDVGDIRYVPNGVTASSNANLVVQAPATGTAPTDTGDTTDDVNGNPVGGAPPKKVSKADQDLLDALIAAGTTNGTH